MCLPKLISLVFVKPNTQILLPSVPCEVWCIADYMMDAYLGATFMSYGLGHLVDLDVHDVVISCCSFDAIISLTRCWMLPTPI